ncbi:hypothetical protein Tco_0277419 [Tanacetum coccineum]
MDFQNELNRLKEILNLSNSNQDPPVDFYNLKGSDEGDNEINSLTKEPSDTFLMWDEFISTTLEKENDEFIKFIDDLVSILRESEVTSVCDNLECDMPVNTPLPPTDVGKEDFDINSPLGEQVVNFLMENVDVAGLPRHLVKRPFSHLLKNPSLTKGMSDEPLVIPLSDSNEDECLAPGDDIEFLLHHDPSTPMISVASILEGFTDEPPLEENDDLFDLESKENEWKNILYDDLMSEDKVFDPKIYEKSFSLTFVKLTFEDRHYFPITFVIRIFLPFLTYSVDSSFLLSSGSEDTIFDPGISTFHFSSLKLVAYENPMVIFPFFCFCPKDKGIRGESS